MFANVSKKNAILFLFKWRSTGEGMLRFSYICVIWSVRESNKATTQNSGYYEGVQTFPKKVKKFFIKYLHYK